MLLRQLFEEIAKTSQNNTAVMGWGRGMGHKGHMLLARAVLHHAQEMDAKAYFVVSRTSLVDPTTGQPWADKPTFTKTKDDPLTPEEKLATYRKVFPQNAEVFSVASADASTLDKVLAKIAGDGFSKVILIVGELEKDSFSFLTRPDKSGVPPYQRAGLKDLEIISRQDTKAPGSDTTAPDYQEGPRATPMRAVLTDLDKSEEEQFAVWRDAMPDDLSDDEVMDLMNKAKQRMAAVPAAKNAKKAKQAVAEISLSEGPSLPSTLKSIATNGEPITQLYGKLKAMAKRWVDNNGSLKGFHRNAAGQSAQWFNNFYFNKLQNDLYALTKQAPKYAPPLIAFLKDASEDRERRINFTEISGSLPPILFQIGKRMGDESLARFAHSWKARKDEYDLYLSQLEAEADTDDEYDEPEVKPEKSKVPGQQNAQVEQIVNDILAKLPKNVAGDIRNAIARAPNKLQALQQELAKRKIQGVAEGSQEINWVKPNFDFEWHEVEEQSRMKQVPVDVRQYYQKHFPNKDAWLKAVQNGKAVVVPPDHAYEIRNAPFDKASLQKVLAPTGHEGPIGPAKEKRVNDLFDKGQVEMPIILKTSQGLWLIGGKTRLGTANYVKGLPAKVWLISGKQGVAEGESNAIDTVAKRLTDPKDGMTAKLRAAGDKRREDKLKGRNISRRDTTSKDEWGDLKQDMSETARMSAAAKLSKAWDQQQAKSAASRKRGEELLNPKKKEEPNFRDKDDKEEISKQSVAEVSLGNVLPWPEVVNKVNSAMKATGWKGKRMSDDAFMFSTRGAEVEDQWYIAIIDNAGDGFFTYALGTVEEGDPHIDDAFKGRLPNTEASVSELMNEIRDGFGLA